MGFEENKRVLGKILTGRKSISLYEGNIRYIEIKGEKQENGVNMIKFLIPIGKNYLLKPYPNQIKNQNEIVKIEANKKDKYRLSLENKGRGTFKIIPIDGKTGIFKTHPPVNQPTFFEYTWITDFSTNKSVVKQAGPCDFLLFTHNFYFFEFKTEAFDIDLTPTTSFNPIQANQHREKAEKQLARTITFFREQAQAKKIAINADFHAILVTLPSFPRMTASLMNRENRFYKQFNASLSEITTEETYLFE